MHLTLLQKVEDTGLDLKPLPEGKAIDVPQELTIECFADVVMIVEFISCYKDLLVPEEKFSLTAGELL
jgi:bromodomain adjacent to zinc finger domain protein 1B